MRRTFRAYLCVVGACSFAGLAGLAAFNALMDPAGAFRSLGLKKLQPYREQIVSRAAKAELIARGQCDVVVLGSSRVQVGIPVNHPAYGTDRVCNLGLNGTTLTETAAVLEFALRHNRLKRVLLGADFLMFSDIRSFSPSFEASRFNPGLDRFDYYCKSLFGSQTTADSWSLFRQWTRHVSPLPGDRGFVPKTVRPGLAQREIFAQRIRKFLMDPETLGAFHYSQRRLEVFRQMVRRCQREKVELIVFIPPVHALQLETIRAAGVWPYFERWKTDLARILGEEGAAGAVPFWDFTGFTGHVAETVPPADDTTTRMKWYLESSHFTPALGELVLGRLLSRSNGSDTEPGLGVRLQTNNVTKHLARLRAERESYVTAHPEELVWVNRIAAEVKGKVAAPVAEF